MYTNQIHMLVVDILIKLRDEDDPKFKVDFHVDFSTMEFIGKDVRSSTCHL
jgi:hypothetical protein